MDGAHFASESSAVRTGSARAHDDGVRPHAHPARAEHLVAESKINDVLADSMNHARDIAAQNGLPRNSQTEHEPREHLVSFGLWCRHVSKGEDRRGSVPAHHCCFHHRAAPVVSRRASVDDRL